MTTIFSKIINGKIPSYKIAEDDHYFAFLDINPLAKGHTLVVPKVEVDYIFELQEDVLAGLFMFCKRVAVAIESEVDCKRIGIAVIGLEVPHAHVHLVPLNSVGDINFSKPKLTLSEKELTDLASRIEKKFK